MKHSHYFKDVSTLQAIDVYRVLSLFAVKDHCIGHAIKKLLCAGQRGSKSIDQDIQEAIDTLLRWQAIRAEDVATVEPGTRVKPWEQPDYCESERYEAWGDLMNDDQASCDHPSWHPFPSLKYEQCVVCGIRRKIAGV